MCSTEVVFCCLLFYFAFLGGKELMASKTQAGANKW